MYIYFAIACFSWILHRFKHRLLHLNNEKGQCNHRRIPTEEPFNLHVMLHVNQPVGN